MRMNVWFRRGLLPSLIAAALLGAFLLGSNGPIGDAAVGDEAPITTAIGNATEAEAHAAPAGSGPYMPKAAEEVPLALPTASALEHPGIGAPVIEVLAALDARARAGDALAACRLIAELSLCKGIRTWSPAEEQGAINRLAMLLKDGDDVADSARQLQAIIDVNNETKRRCEGIADADLRALPEYAFAGARSGHPPSLAYFAAGHVGGEQLVADPALYNAYRQHAWPMFQRALEAGSPPAVASWNWALNSNGYAYFAGVIPEPWRKPGVARHLHERLQIEQGAIPQTSPRTDTDPADLVEADALFMRHFQNSPWLTRKPYEPPPPRAVHVPKYELKLDHCEPPAQTP